MLGGPPDLNEVLYSRSFPYQGMMRSEANVIATQGPLTMMGLKATFRGIVMDWNFNAMEFSAIGHTAEKGPRMSMTVANKRVWHGQHATDGAVTLDYFERGQGCNLNPNDAAFKNEPSYNQKLFSVRWVGVWG
jgi:hypothetical protein